MLSGSSTWTWASLEFVLVGGRETVLGGTPNKSLGATFGSVHGDGPAMFGIPYVVLGIKMGSLCVSVFTPVLSLSECLPVFLFLFLSSPLHGTCRKQLILCYSPSIGMLCPWHLGLALSYHELSS